MSSIRLCVIEKLTPSLLLERYPHLLFSQWKQKLSRAPSYENMIAIVALKDDKEIGLLVAGIVNGLPAADLA